MRGHLAQQLRQLDDRVARRAVQGIDRAAQLVDRLLRELLGGAEPVRDAEAGLAQPLGLATGHLDGHAGREDVLRDRVVQLAGDPVAFGVDQLALVGQHQAVLDLAQLGGANLEVAFVRPRFVVQQLGTPVQRHAGLVLLGGVQRDRGLVGEDAEHRQVARLGVDVEPVQADEAADGLPLEGHRHPHPATVVVAADGVAGADGAELAAYQRRQAGVVVVGWASDRPAARARGSAGARRGGVRRTGPARSTPRRGGPARRARPPPAVRAGPRACGRAPARSSPWRGRRAASARRS